MFDWLKRKQMAVDQPVCESVKDTPRCSFCNKTTDEVRKLIAGPGVYICDECVEVCVHVIADGVAQQGLQADSSESERARAMAAALPEGAVACSLCGQLALSNEVLSIPGRGELCGECADAVEDAIAR